MPPRDADAIHRSSVLLTRSGEAHDLVGKKFRCPVCGNERSGPSWARVAEFDIVRCLSCGVLHLAPLPDPKCLYALYQEDYFCDSDERHGYRDYEADRLNVERTYALRLARVAATALRCQDPRPLARVHEIGAALGYGLPIAEKQFYANVSASDISLIAVEACIRAGYRAMTSDNRARCDLPHQSIDLVYLFDVIEHLTDVGPFVDWLAGVIRPGGFVAFTTPDMDHIINRLLGRRSPSIKVPQHVTYFTRPVLDATFATGFEPVNCYWDWQRVDWSLLSSRLRMMLGLALPETRKHTGSGVWVPNGMRLFIYRRRLQSAGAPSQ